MNIESDLPAGLMFYLDYKYGKYAPEQLKELNESHLILENFHQYQKEQFKL